MLKSLHYLPYLSVYYLGLSIYMYLSTVSSKQLEKQTSMISTEPQNNAYNIAIRTFFIYKFTRSNFWRLDFIHISYFRCHARHYVAKRIIVYTVVMLQQKLKSKHHYRTLWGANFNLQTIYIDSCLGYSLSVKKSTKQV